MQQNTRVATRKNNDVAIIDIEGEVTSFSEKILESTYEKLSKDGFKKICLNFDKVSYINSAGMAILIGILTKSRNSEQTLRCWGLTDHFQKIFDMVGITRYMAHAQNERDAVNGF